MEPGLRPLASTSATPHNRLPTRRSDLLAASVLALNDAPLEGRLAAWRKQQTDAVKERPEGPA